MAKVIIVDDHKMFREGLKHILKSMDNSIAVVEATNGIEFLDILNEHEPDLVLLDISMPYMDGIEATTLALKKKPNLKIIALSMFGDEKYYNKMIAAGVKGFILKESSSTELKEAMETVMNGGSYFSQELLRKIIENIGNKENTKVTSEKNQTFTSREKEVLKYICEGMNNNEIGDKLHLSNRTVEGHRGKLLKKTNTKNTINLIMYAIKNGLVEI